MKANRQKRREAISPKNRRRVLLGLPSKYARAKTYFKVPVSARQWGVGALQADGTRTGRPTKRALRRRTPRAKAGGAA